MHNFSRWFKFIRRSGAADSEFAFGGRGVTEIEHETFMRPAPGRLILATGNRHKVEEISSILSDALEGPAPLILCAADFSGLPEPVEDADTFQGNARIKASHYARLTGHLTLADDSGLVVDALDGRPGVRSARYAPTDPERIARLLGEMEGVAADRRTARFVCAVALCDREGGIICREGSVEGRIATAPGGKGGFGYDPVFIPDTGDGPDARRTLAEHSAEEKNALSHRGIAMRLISPVIALALATGQIPADCR